MTRHTAPEIRPRRTVSEAVHGTVLETSPEVAELNALHARVFGTPDGAKMLAHFRAITVERVLPPESSDGALREAEAGRRFVKQIEQRIARHFELSMRPDPGTNQA